MNILAINTANKSLFLALKVGQKVFSSEISAQAHHNEAIIPAIDALLKSNNLKLVDIDKFAVVVGPGSFTGIRVGIATIKAFRDALAIPAVEVNNLDYLYALAINQFKNVGAVAIRGSQNSYFVAKYINGKVYKFPRNLTEQELKFYAENQPVAMFEEDDFANSKTVKLSAEVLLNLAEVSQNEGLTPVYYQLSQAEREKLKKGTISVKSAHKKDLDFIAKLEGEISASALNKSQIESILTNKNYSTKLICFNNIPVGFIILQITDEVNVVSIAINKEMRNLGLATRLIKSAINLAKRKKLNAVSLEVSYNNITAYLLYKKLGFQTRRVRKNYYSDGSDGIEMVINIAQ